MELSGARTVSDGAELTFAHRPRPLHTSLKVINVSRTGVSLGKQFSVKFIHMKCIREDDVFVRIRKR